MRRRSVMNRGRMTTLSLCCLAVMAAMPAQADRAGRLAAVKTFADTMLVKAVVPAPDGKTTPLLADGVDPKTGAPLQWVFPDGRTAVLSNFSAQQNFMRVLAGLSALTGDDKYQAVAKANIRYYFDHYQDKSGLLYWGGHRFVDLHTGKVEGPSEKELVHELKNAYPYYDLMFAVDKAATARFIRAFWNAHIYDWKTLETSRHGEFGKTLGRLWASDFSQQPPFFATKGLSFLNAGNDLIYAAAELYRHDPQEAGALQWAQRLAQQYVLARDPQTGLGVYQFTQALKRASTTDDSDTHSKYGDRAQRQFGPEFGASALEGNMLLKGRTGTIYAENALMQLQVAQDLGKEGATLQGWTLQGLKAFAHYGYDAATNTFRPLLANGTDLSNHTLPRDGYYGKKGMVLKPYPAGSEFLLSYARAYRLAPDAALWQVVRGIARGEGLGEVGAEPGKQLALDMTTRNADPHVLFAVLDLYQTSQAKPYLALAERIGDNLVAKGFHGGYFMPHADMQFANIDSIAPYALLALEAALQGKPTAVAPFINGAGFTEGAYRMADGRVRIATRDDELFALRHGEALLPNGKK